jgi:hypothetical protein
LIEGGNLVIYKNTIPSTLMWSTSEAGFTNLTQSACVKGRLLILYQEWAINGVNNTCDAVEIQDNGLLAFWENGIKMLELGTASSCPTTTSTTTTQSTTTNVPCIGDTIYSGQCLYPGQALCSKNGCFKIIVENSVLICYRTSDMTVAWKQPLRSVNACMASSGVFGALIQYPGPSDAVLTDDGQLITLLRSTGERNLGNFGIASTCNSNSICSQSVIDVGECFVPGQVKVSCNGCFKMVLEGGNLVVYHNNLLGLQPVFTYSIWGLAVKACGEGTYFQFYTSDGSPVGGVGPEHDYNGVIAKVLDNGQIVFAAKNASIAHVFTFGNATSCYVGSTLAPTAVPTGI